MKPRLLQLAITFLALMVFSAAAETLYVDLNCPSPTPPYTNWLTAATNIQDAVDAAVDGDLVLVTNGVYATGGRVAYGVLTNRVAVTKTVTVQSVNGPGVTEIDGFQVPDVLVGDAAVRCVYLTNGAGLSGFTLKYGGTRDYLGDYWLETRGGGVFGEAGAFISNCVLIANVAYARGGGAYGVTVLNSQIVSNLAVGLEGYGGGASDSVLNNCLVVGNGTDDGCGGGVWQCSLTNCTVVGNTAGWNGGGAFNSLMFNSIIYDNVPDNYSDIFDSGSLDFCCTTPLPVTGNGNITNEPLFIDALAGDLRLQSNSPCIHTGNNDFYSGETDIAGNPRISDKIVDMGAYEFQWTDALLFDVWKGQYGLPTDGSADFVDTDGDGMNNWQEWRADTVPTNGTSALRIVALRSSSYHTVKIMTVEWESSDRRSYFIERSTNLGAVPPFERIASDYPGTAGNTLFNDYGADAAGGPYFYRVGVE